LTSVRRRLLDGVVGAPLITSLFGAGCQSHSATEPIGKLSREDAIAYLIVSDQLVDIRETVKVPFTVCISTGAQAEMLSGYPDPSTALMARLTDANAAQKGTLRLKPASGCAWDGPAITDRSTGLNAFLVHSTDSTDPRHSECGQFEGGWRGGTLFGGGNYYTVDIDRYRRDRGQVSIERSACFLRNRQPDTTTSWRG